MVDRNIINKLGLSHEQIEAQVNELFTDEHSQLLEKALDQKVDTLIPGTILSGRIVTRLGNNVIVELGLKSEGIVDASEFDDPEEIAAGRELEVLLEEVDAEGGILLSKRKADRIRGWERIVTSTSEGDLVKGRVTRRIKGGLLVDIGVPVFLPASQVDIRKPGDISRFIGQQIECKILKIDSENRNIVVSRRKIIEEERNSSKEKLLKEIEVGQPRKGIVKNIADFGVFVDLGGLDGLLHISDLSWGRISHPSEVVRLDQEVECIVIGFDRGNEKISLGLKQKAQSPWETVEQCYPIGSRVKGTVVNIMNYGAFIRLEEGVEGLVHISEMSWTRRIIHPADILNLNDEIEVVVLDVNKNRQEISLGIKQLETNPWTVAAQKYPPGTIVTTRVTSLMNYGAFVEIEPGIDGLVHISDLSWTRKYNHPGDALERGRELKCVVLEVDEEKHRVSLGIKQMTENPWIRAIPEKYIPGQIVKGRVTKLTNFGVFVELEPDLEGLLHISELADHKVDSPKDVVKTEEEIEVKILRVDADSRKIGLSLRRVRWAAEDAAGKDKPRRRGGLDGPPTPTPDAVAGAGKDKRKEKQKKQPPQAKEEKQEIKEEKKGQIEPKQEQPQEEKKEEPEQQPTKKTEDKEQEVEKQPESSAEEEGQKVAELKEDAKEPEDKQPQEEKQEESAQRSSDEAEVEEQKVEEQPEEQQPQEEKKEEPEQQPTKKTEDKEQEVEKQPESSAKEEDQKVAELKEDAKEPEDKQPQEEKQEEPEQQPTKKTEDKEQQTEKQPEQPEQEPEPIEEQQPQEEPEDKEQQESQTQEEQPPAQEQDVAGQPEQEQKKNKAQKRKKKEKEQEQQEDKE